MKRHFLNHVLPILFMIALVGCGSKNNTKLEATNANLPEADSVRSNVLKSLKGSQITKKLFVLGVPFQPESLNNYAKTNHYLVLSNKAAAAANLGVYMSDLGYLVDLEKKASGNYFDACLILSEYVGLKKQFSNAVDLRFHEIISGNESIEKTASVAFKGAENTSDPEDFKKLHAAALTGYYFEELYRLVFLIKTYEKKILTDSTQTILRSTVSLLLNQKQEISHLIRYYDHINLQPKGIVLYQDLLKLQLLFLSPEIDQLKTETNTKKILENKKVIDIFNFVISIRDGITKI